MKTRIYATPAVKGLEHISFTNNCDLNGQIKRIKNSVNGVDSRVNMVNKGSRLWLIVLIPYLVLTDGWWPELSDMHKHDKYERPGVNIYSRKVYVNDNFDTLIIMKMLIFN